jgi:NAD-dependent deacetylase sirtuin 4
VLVGKSAPSIIAVVVASGVPLSRARASLGRIDPVDRDNPVARDERIDRLCQLAAGGDVAILSGAGLSTESGIPDYRSPEGLSRARRPIHGPDFVRSETSRRRYWARAMLGWDSMRAATPNAGHRALAALEARGIVSRIVTQNVDRLHHKAGSVRALELHGALAEVGCLACGAIEDRDALQARLLALNPGWTAAARAEGIAPDGDADVESERIDRFVIAACERCGGVLKPRVVFFGENVTASVVNEAYAEVERAKLLLVVGTSLAVFSGYRFLRRAVERGIPVAIVNRGPVRGEEGATLKIEDGTGSVLSALDRALASGKELP